MIWHLVISFWDLLEINEEYDVVMIENAWRDRGKGNKAKSVFFLKKAVFAATSSDISVIRLTSNLSKRVTNSFDYQ